MRLPSTERTANFVRERKSHPRTDSDVQVPLHAVAFVDDLAWKERCGQPPAPIAAHDRVVREMLLTVSCALKPDSTAHWGYSPHAADTQRTLLPDQSLSLVLGCAVHEANHEISASTRWVTAPQFHSDALRHTSRPYRLLQSWFELPMRADRSRLWRWRGSRIGARPQNHLP